MAAWCELMGMLIHVFSLRSDAPSRITMTHNLA
jgi:hypothetical protein